MDIQYSLRKIEPLLSRSKSLPLTDDRSHSTSSKGRFTSKVYYNSRLEHYLRSIPMRTPVNLSYWNLIDDDMPMIASEILADRQCPVLDLCGNRFTWQCVSSLVFNLSNNFVLEILDLSYNRLSNRGVHLLCQILSNNRCVNLRKLFLNKNGIAHDGARALSNMLQVNRTLTELQISHNEIDNSSVEYLANALAYHNRTLQALVLSFNMFLTDRCVDHLLTILRYNSTLTNLSINDCNLSETGRNRVRHEVDRNEYFRLDA
jgi:Ran GTPase-activating protein (RanGAP) involved in mRNA processing and transport